MALIEALAADRLLDQKYLDHPLSGDWRDHRDCHFRPDLVLIYRKTEGVLQLVRLGSHSELGSSSRSRPATGPWARTWSASRNDCPDGEAGTRRSTRLLRTPAARENWQ